MRMMVWSSALNLITVISVGSDKVISTSPKAGSQVAKGDTITITASKGKETKTTIVPNLLGQNIDDAIQMIKDAGLTYNASPVITATAIVRTRL